MQCLGCVNFQSKFVEKLHINLKPIYTLLHDVVKFQWTPSTPALSTPHRLVHTTLRLTSSTGLCSTHFNGFLPHQLR